MLETIHDIFSTIWNGLKRAVKFVVEVLLFIPKLIIEGIETLFDIKEADAPEADLNYDFSEYSAPPAKKAESTEMKKIETAETQKQAQAVQEQMNQKTGEAATDEPEVTNETEEIETEEKSVEKNNSSETAEEESKEEVAAENHQDSQTGVKIERLEGEIVDGKKVESNDYQEAKVAESVETTKKNSSKVDEPTEEEQNVLYDINYRIVEHIKESPFPKQDYELLKSYDTIADDMKKGNLGVTFTLRKASRDLIEALAFRNGYIYNPLCVDEDARANDELKYLYGNNLITDEEHFILNKRANEAILGTPDTIKAAEQQLMQMIDEYFYIFYPKCNPTNTLENIRARKKAAEANRAAL